jgi:hypothetical protein
MKRYEKVELLSPIILNLSITLLASRPKGLPELTE